MVNSIWTQAMKSLQDHSQKLISSALLWPLPDRGKWGKMIPCWHQNCKECIWFTALQIKSCWPRIITRFCCLVYTWHVTDNSKFLQPKWFVCLLLSLPCNNLDGEIMYWTRLCLLFPPEITLLLTKLPFLLTQAAETARLSSAYNL